MAETRVKDESVFSAADYILFGILSCLLLAASLYFLRTWYAYSDWGNQPLVCLTFTLIVLIRLANSHIRWLTLPMMRRPQPMMPRPELRVAVVTTFVPGSESLEMLEETVRALVALEYPHDTWVLDEGDDRQVRELCRKAGAYHFSRKGRAIPQTDEGRFSSGSKYGNYNCWLYEVGFDRYEILSAFDPDHVPHASFLMKTLGYFEDPDVGYVQAPQAYYNQNAGFIARGASEETCEYYSCTQMAANRFRMPAVVGSHNTHRVEALREVGGFAPHDADDLLIGLFYQSRGWRGVYVPEILARGVTPVDWNGYLVQQLRWARSVIDIRFRLHHYVGGGIPATGHLLSILHGIFYLQFSLTTFVFLVLLALMLATGADPGVFKAELLPGFGILASALCVCALYRRRFYLDKRREYGLQWRAALLRYAKWPVFLKGALDVVRRRSVPYALTLKIRSETASSMLVIPHALVIVLIGAACGIGLVLNVGAPFFLYLVATGIIALSVVLILTGSMNFPAPFDRDLLYDEWLSESALPESGDSLPSRTSEAE